MNPDAILNYALFVDADATDSPEISAIVRNKGGSGTGDNCNSQLQTMGNLQANGSVIRVYDADGNIKFRLTQDGSLIAPNWQVDSGGTEHSNAPSSYNVGAAGVAATPPSRPAEGMDIYHNGNLRSIPLYVHA